MEDTGRLHVALRLAVGRDELELTNDAAVADLNLPGWAAHQRAGDTRFQVLPSPVQDRPRTRRPAAWRRPQHQEAAERARTETQTETPGVVVPCCDARLHDAQHTAATVLVLLGVPERAFMEIMGWSHSAMAARYQHLTAAIRGDIASRIGGLLWGPDEVPPGETGAK